MLMQFAGVYFIHQGTCFQPEKSYGLLQSCIIKATFRTSIPYSQGFIETSKYVVLFVTFITKATFNMRCYSMEFIF